jgi:hypothetical protein
MKFNAQSITHHLSPIPCMVTSTPRISVTLQPRVDRLSVVNSVVYLSCADVSAGTAVAICLLHYTLAVETLRTRISDTHTSLAL